MPTKPKNPLHKYKFLRSGVKFACVVRGMSEIVETTPEAIAHLIASNDVQDLGAVEESATTPTVEAGN